MIERDVVFADVMQRIDEFNIDGIRICMLINRGIGNSNKGSKRWINKLISWDAPSFRENVFTLLTQQLYLKNPDIRLYTCVNERNLDKAIKYFNHKQLEILQDNKEKFYCNINSSFVSCLMKPENRKTSYFLIDQDNHIDILQQLKDKEINIILDYSTPNGHHYITTPFNPILLQGIENCEIKKDALILLNALREF